ncbi:MAG: DUF5654 family protein [Candidatus Aenigmarchaeota archaeon]
MVAFENHAAKMDIKGIVITMILGAFGFLVALQWRDAIKGTIDLFLPGGEGLMYTYVAAILVTVIAVAVTFVLIKLKDVDIIPDKYENRVKDKARRAKERAKSKVRRKKK